MAGNDTDIYDEDAQTDGGFADSTREFLSTTKGKAVALGTALVLGTAAIGGVVMVRANSEAQEAQAQAEAEMAATTTANPMGDGLDYSDTADSDFAGAAGATDAMDAQVNDGTKSDGDNVYSIRDSGGSAGMTGTGLGADEYADAAQATATTRATNADSTGAATTTQAVDPDDPFAVGTDDAGGAVVANPEPAPGAGSQTHAYTNAKPATALRQIMLNMGQNYVASNGLVATIATGDMTSGSDGTPNVCGDLVFTNRSAAPITIDESRDTDWFVLDTDFNEYPVLGGIYATTIAPGQSVKFNACASSSLMGNTDNILGIGWRPATAPDRVAVWKFPKTAY